MEVSLLILGQFPAKTLTCLWMDFYLSYEDETGDPRLIGGSPWRHFEWRIWG